MSASKEDVKRRQVIVILEQAALETVKTSKGYQLLNCDDHKGIHKKLNREASQSRPDILHQELMALLDSPLNKAGYLKMYIQSSKGVLVEVSSQMRVPRTYKRFAGLMVQLAAHAQDPVVGRQPHAAERDQEPRDQSLPTDEPVVFIFGAMAHGHISKENCNYLDETISISEYPMSGAQAICRLLNGFERHWGIL
ncbi:hypothetical protein PRIC2_012762 [Phytophthora ramorum]